MKSKVNKTLERFLKLPNLIFFAIYCKKLRNTYEHINLIYPPFALTYCQIIHPCWASSTTKAHTDANCKVSAQVQNCSAQNNAILISELLWL